MGECFRLRLEVCLVQDFEGIQSLVIGYQKRSNKAKWWGRAGLVEWKPGTLRTGDASWMLLVTWRGVALFHMRLRQEHVEEETEGPETWGGGHGSKCHSERERCGLGGEDKEGFWMKCEKSEPVQMNADGWIKKDRWCFVNMGGDILLWSLSAVKHEQLDFLHQLCVVLYLYIYLG